MTDTLLDGFNRTVLKESVFLKSDCVIQRNFEQFTTVF